MDDKPQQTFLGLTMDKKENNVLRALIAAARRGQAVSDVFDLMYETSLPYCELRDILNALISQKEVEYIDIRTYKFIGDISREIGEEPEEDEDGEPTDDDNGEIIEERLSHLRRHRLELFRRMRRNSGISDDDDGGTDESDEALCDDEDNTGTDIFDEDDEPLFSDEDDEYDEDNDEEVLHKNLVKILTDEREKSKLRAEALRLCVREGYISESMLCERLKTDRDTASDICIGLYLNDITEADVEGEGYKLCISEEFFLSCCAEADERKKSLGGLSDVIKKIALQRQAEEEMNKLRSIILSDTSLNRTKAIIKAEGCLLAVRDAGNEIYAAVYKNIIDRLKSMSDYMFDRLKKQSEG